MTTLLALLLACGAFYVLYRCCLARPENPLTKLDPEWTVDDEDRYRKACREGR